MPAFTVTVQDREVQADLKALVARVDNMAPVFQTLGEGIIERTKRRFDTSSAPDGTPWKPNSAATLAMLSARLGGKRTNRKKSGALNAKGNKALVNKKPLIDSGFLRQQIVQFANRNSLTVTATAKYAAIHQFSGKAGRGHKVTIPARPFLPVRQDGTLYPQEQAHVLQALNDYLMGDL